MVDYDILKPDIENLDEDEAIPFEYSISSYGADYDVFGLIRRLDNEDIELPTFQRGFVWEQSRSSRFIESLLLGLPVPGIFLSKAENEKLLVIDGQQRLMSLKYFYDGNWADGTVFRLKNLETRFQDLTYKELAPEDRRRLDNSIIHTTVVEQDKPTDDNSSIYFIFERLNTGSKPLTPQEIRAAIYRGEFNDLLQVLDSYPNWKVLVGDLNRRRGEELILRFLAMYLWFDNYVKTMKSFLNEYMGKNRHLRLHTAEQLTIIFNNTVDVIHNCLGEGAFRPTRAVNAAVMDAIMIGIARRLEKGEIRNCTMLSERHYKLIKDPKFLRASTSDIGSVNQRLKLSNKAFSDVD
jgi:hypothetical protein